MINDIENTASVVGYNKGIINLFVPYSIKYDFKIYIVIGILKGAFQSAHIKSVVFSKESKLKTIGEDAFYNSTICGIKIPSEVKQINKNAFYYNENFKKLDIPNDSKLEIIGEYSFACTSIKNVRIPSKVKLIAKKAFFMCKQLQIIEIADDLEKDSFDISILFDYESVCLIVPVYLSRHFNL